MSHYGRPELEWPLFLGVTERTHHISTPSGHMDIIHNRNNYTDVGEEKIKQWSCVTYVNGLVLQCISNGVVLHISLALCKTVYLQCISNTEILQSCTEPWIYTLLCFAGQFHLHLRLIHWKLELGAITWSDDWAVTNLNSKSLSHDIPSANEGILKNMDPLRTHDIP